MHDYKVAVGNDQPGFVLEGRWKALYEVEQSFAPRLNVRAALDVVRRPEPLSPRVVSRLLNSVSTAFAAGLLFPYEVSF
jgi:hypothetical protein